MSHWKLSSGMGVIIRYIYFFKIVSFSVVSLLLGCAHLADHEKNPSSQFSQSLMAPQSLTEILGRNLSSAATEGNSVILSQSQDLVVRGIRLKNTQFDFPITVNSRVEDWVDYFTSGNGKEHFQRYFERSEYFIPYIKPILKQNNLPEDLVYLAMIESGFNNFARSRARAVGPWQFISATGRRYGLMVNWWVDERRDIRKSTLAAVEYLRDLYQIFQSWELAAAAYNAGETKIARAIQKYGTRDFWVLSKQRRFLKPETKNYVPKIIAAALIAKNLEQFGFVKIKNHELAANEVIAADGELVQVIQEEKGSDDDSKNDKIKNELSSAETVPGVTPSTWIVPSESTPLAGQGVPLAKPVPVPHISKDGIVGGAEIAEFDIKSPADLLKIARASGLSYQTVKSMNPELLRWCTPPAMKTYRLRLPASVKERFLETYNHIAFPKEVNFLTYKVLRGETLSQIARHYGIKVDPIEDLNGVSPRMSLKVGIRVVLPIPNDRSRSLASLDLKDPPDKRRIRRHRRGGQRYYKVTSKRREDARVIHPAPRGGI